MGITKNHEQRLPPRAAVLHSEETILSVLARHVKERPDHALFRWVNKQGNVSDSLTYMELWDKSCAVAELLGAKTGEGDRVMIVYPFGLDFLAGLIGCMMAGVTACSVYPPNPKKLKIDLPAFHLKVQDAQAKYALTTLAFRRIMGLSNLVGHKSKVTWLTTDGLHSPSSEDWRRPNVLDASPDRIAFIQYTSGSTGRPKGVMISQRSLLHNSHLCSATSNALSVSDPGERSEFTVVSWMPQYHDMGLIGFFFTVIYSGIRGVVCSPVDFILDPILWHTMMIKYKARATLGPNFAFGLLVKRLQARKEQRVEQWTNVDRVVCAAEPVDPQVMNQVMSVLGVHKTSLYVGYGLAEVGLAVCFSPYGVSNDDGLVACGDLQSKGSKKKKKIRIVDDQGWEVADGTIGEVFVQSPNQVALGYWGNPELSRSTFCRQIENRAGNWLATGDLGKVEHNQVFIAGRKKELIIINGRNVYPHDIERLLESEFPNIIRPGSTVAFQNSDSDVGIALEIRKTVKSLDAVSGEFSETSIRRLVSDACEVSIGNIQLLKQGSIPKTTSGKLKRVETRRASLAGSWAADKVLKSVTESACSSTLACETSVGGEVGGEATIKSVVGQDVDMKARWETNGLTSLMHAELITRVQEVHQVTLPINFQQTCPTPHQLKILIEISSSGLFPAKLPKLDQTRNWTDSCKSLPLPVLGVLQVIGVLLLLLLFAVCLIPPYYIGKYAEQLSTTFQIGDSGRFATVSWLPAAVPVFFVTFSVVVVLLKWIVIGRYRSGVVDLPSVSYLRWWFMDRLMDLWERWVGGFIVDTKLIWVFYRLLGARLAWSCNVKSFIREFDLVEVGSDTSIEHQIRCRKFLPWRDNEAPSLVFRPVVVGSNCTVKGMLGPGANLGGSSKVDKFSSLPEGSQVPEGTLVKGSPAFNAGSYHGVKRKRGYWLVELLKVVWLLVETYLFFGLLLLSQIFLNVLLAPIDWRYMPLMYWILLLLLATSIFGVMASIVLKWSFIGRRRPGTDDSSPWSRICRWCCDYHFSIVAMTLVPFLGMSRLWNFILFLHGLDVDLVSKPGASLASFPPSKVDLVRIRRSFLSNVSIDSDHDYIEIVESSLGFNVHIGTGVQIVRSVIPPRAVVNESIFDSNFQDDNFQDDDQRSNHSCIKQIIMENFQLVSALLICASFIPAYELFVATVFDAQTGVAVLWLCLIMVVQSLSWIIVERLLQMLLQLSSAPAHLFVVYSSYLTTAWQNHDWNILVTCLRGTFFIRCYLWFMGSRVEGQLWYFGSDIYDFPKLSFEDKTIIDDAHIAGHHVVFGNVVLDDTRVGGVVHPGTYCPAGAQVVGHRESGPWKVYLGGRGEKHLRDDSDSTTPYNDGGLCGLSP